ncbi:MAG: TMEM165/GDT1 family protein [Anaerolineae bacterium]|nr:TMEM165/GDT1 family protein [Anaerolineae bacterium]
MDWGTWLSAFGLVFVAELGDKTQLAVVSQTCKFRRPWAVFLGGSLALTAVTAIGAAGGRVLNAFIPQDVIRIVAALAFVLMGFLIWREAKKADARAACELPDEGECATAPGVWDWRAFGATFSLLFLAELGDKTQLAVLGLASKQPSAWVAFTGGAAALTAVTAIGVVGGEKLCQLIPERLLLRISAGAFVVMGVLMGMGIL